MKGGGGRAHLFLITWPKDISTIKVVKSDWRERGIDGAERERGSEDSKKGAGVDRKCEELASAISERVSESGAAAHFSDFAEQWSRSSRAAQSGIKSGSQAFGGS